jgi:hypothetical protein
LYDIVQPFQIGGAFLWGEALAGAASLSKIRVKGDQKQDKHPFNKK